MIRRRSLVIISRDALTAGLLCVSILGIVAISANRSHAAPGTDRITISYLGTPTNGASTRPWLAKNGSAVAFLTGASNLFNPPYSPGAVVKDLGTNCYDLIAVNPTASSVTIPRVCDPSNRPSLPSSMANVGPPYISGDGRYVVFHANSYSNGCLSSSGIFLVDRQTLTRERVDITSSAEPQNPLRLPNGSCAASSNPVVSDDGRYVAFVSTAVNLLPPAEDNNNVADIYLRDRVAGTIERVSLTTVNGEANGASDGKLSISADGRFVAFESVANNLVPNDLNARRDIFVRDRGLGGNPTDTLRVSISSTQVEGNDDSSYPSISDNGRYIAFESRATNLVTGDTNGRWDIFVRDTVLATTYRASVSSIGVQAAGGDSRYPSITADGKSVAYASGATNLVPLDWNGLQDVFVSDLIEKRTYLASRTLFGSQASGGTSGFPSIAGDGLTVAFESLANNLATEPDDSNNVSDIFVRRIFSLPERISADGAGTQGTADANRPTISRDGRYVAFHTLYPFDPADSNGVGDVYVKDRLTDAIERVSISNTGEEPNGRSTFASISGDGRYIAFASTATNLITETIDNNGVTDIYLRDRIAQRTYLVSQNDSGAIGSGGDSRFPAISDSGRFVAFQSEASNLVPGDTNGAWDVFLRDTLLNTTIRISVKSDGSQASTGSPVPYSTRPSISTGGGLVVFHSWATDLVDASSPGGADTNGQPDVYLRDWMNGITERVSLTSTGGQATGGPSQFASISSNGRFIAFHSSATNLVTGDGNGKRDVFVRDRQAGKTYRFSVSSSGVEANADSGYAKVAPNDVYGALVTFHSEATNLIAPGVDTNNVRDCYARWVPLSGTQLSSTGNTWRVATKRPGFETSPALQYSDWSGTCIASRDATPVVFQTAATDVISGADTNGSTVDIFVAEA
jgi:hypothetical protein